MQASELSLFRQIFQQTRRISRVVGPERNVVSSDGRWTCVRTEIFPVETEFSVSGVFSDQSTEIWRNKIFPKVFVFELSKVKVFEPTGCR